MSPTPTVARALAVDVARPRPVVVHPQKVVHQRTGGNLRPNWSPIRSRTGRGLGTGSASSSAPWAALASRPADKPVRGVRPRSTRSKFATTSNCSSTVSWAKSAGSCIAGTPSALRALLMSPRAAMMQFSRVGLRPAVLLGGLAQLLIARRVVHLVTVVCAQRCHPRPATGLVVTGGRSKVTGMRRQVLGSHSDRESGDGQDHGRHGHEEPLGGRVHHFGHRFGAARP